MNIDYRTVDVHSIVDPKAQQAIRVIDQTLRPLVQMLKQVIVMDPGSGTPMWSSGVIPRHLEADPRTEKAAYGKVGEFAIGPDGALYEKTVRTEIDNNWRILGGLGAGANKPHAPTHAPDGADPIGTGAPINVDLDPNAEGSSQLFSRADHHHYLDEDIEPVWTGPHYWRLANPAETPISIEADAAQTANLATVYDSALTELTVMDYQGDVAIGTGDATGAHLTVQGRAADAEDAILDMGPWAWFDANDPDATFAASSASYANGGQITTWSDKSGNGRDLPFDPVVNRKPCLWKVAASGTGSPTNLPTTGLPVVGTVSTGAGTQAFTSMVGAAGSFHNLGVVSFTVFVVARTIPPAIGNISYLGSDTNTSFTPLNFGPNTVGTPDTVLIQYRSLGTQQVFSRQQVTFTSNPYWRFTFQRDVAGAAHHIYYDNGELTVAGAGASGTPLTASFTPQYLLVTNTGGSFTYHSNHLAEVLIFTSALTVDEIAEVHAYLDNKWGLENSTGGGAGASKDLQRWQEPDGDIVARVTTTGIGVGIDPARPLHVVSTTEQVRIGYSATSYLSITVDSSGNATFNVTAASGTPEIRYSDETVHNGGIDLGTSGRIDSNVPDTGSNIGILIKPTTAFTAGRAVFSIQTSAAYPFLHGHAGTNVLEIGGSGGSTNDAMLTVSATTAKNAGIFFAPASFTGAGAVGFGVTGLVTGAYFRAVSSAGATLTKQIGGGFENDIPSLLTVNRDDVWGAWFRPVGVVGTGSGTNSLRTFARTGGWRVIGIPSIGKNAGTFTALFGGYIENMVTGTVSSSGSGLTNSYGLVMEEQNKATGINDTLRLLGSARIAFGEAAHTTATTEYINSSADTILDLNANASINFKVNSVANLVVGTTEINANLDLEMGALKYLRMASDGATYGGSTPASGFGHLYVYHDFGLSGLTGLAFVNDGGEECRITAGTVLLIDMAANYVWTGDHEFQGDFSFTGTNFLTSTIAPAFGAETVFGGDIRLNGHNIATGSVAGQGVMFGTANTERIAFYGNTPISQATPGAIAGGFIAGAGAAVDHLATWTGGVGANTYTVGDIVQHLKNLGLLKS